MNNQWLSAHIFYSEPFIELLKEVITPTIKQLQNDKKIEGYFFIRYWERGPHIRLRIKSEPETIDKYIKPLVLSTFTKFKTEFPSDRKEPEWVNNLPSSKKWYPNNCIQFIEYKPEIERYGGEHIINLAEAHFQHSSDAVLQIISSCTSWGYNSALGAALQLHLSFAYAVGLNKSQTKYFFNQIYLAWFSKAFQSVSTKLKQERGKKPEKVLDAFRAAFEKQKESLEPFIDTFWDLLENNTPFKEQWLNDWIKNVKKTDQKLRIKQENGELTLPYKILANSMEISIYERWSIYNSFIHMTNNRLGILNRDEGYLGFLIKEALKNEK